MGRPAKTSLEHILDAAEATVDAEGPRGLGLRGLARALDLTAPSVMAHVGDLDRLKDRLRDRAQRSLADALSTGGEGPEALLNGWRGFVAEHPGRYALLAETPRALTEGPILRAVVAGLPHNDRTRALATIAGLHGLVTLEGAGGLGTPRAADAVAVAMLPARQADAPSGTPTPVEPTRPRATPEAFRPPRLRLGGRG